MLLKLKQRTNAPDRFIVWREKSKEHLEERFFNKEDSIWRLLEANMHENDYSAELEF